nr:helix-turn-helix domain-containing protein [Candidatus Korarchaeota archaeon]
MPVILTKRLLSEKEACAYLSIGRTKLYELVKRGDILPVRIDTSPRYD